MAGRFEFWKPLVELSSAETGVMKLCKRVQKLFGFLRLHRDDLFSEEFQLELETMYRGGGHPPVPPAMMAMATLLQGYEGASDSKTVVLSGADARWRMVLGLGFESTEPAFSQGALCDFRHRLIRTGMDRRLLERTIELARETKAFDPKHLRKKLRIAADSSPLHGAGRVEDTINLLGHAARKVVQCIVALSDLEFGEVCEAAGTPLLLESSIKKGLDCEWDDPKQKSNALKKLIVQLDSLRSWIGQNLPAELAKVPLKDALETLQQITCQDLEPDPDDPSGGARIRRGVAVDRRPSVEDSEMRHGRKSKSKKFNGFKRHIALDLDTTLIIACEVMPANRAEADACKVLNDDIERQGFVIDSLSIDRGYISSGLVGTVLSRGGTVLCKPWVAKNSHGLFTKSKFRLNMRSMSITCPAGAVQPARPGTIAKFDAATCDSCGLKPQCTTSSNGRTVRIAHDEKLQQSLRKASKTRRGRERLRERIPVEHSLAHISQRQGNRARYRGTQSNRFDLRRAATIQNLEITQRHLAA